jgi:raffinose/stachyose/melibiose transport system substrate-binding protein
MSRKYASLLFAFVLMFVVLMSGCSGSGNESKSADNANSSSESVTDQQAEDNTEPGNQEPVELVWITHSPETEQEREIFQKDVVEAFEASHPNVTVKWVEAQDSYSLIRQQLAAGAGPDIVSTGGPTFLAEYVSSGYLLPLDEYAAKYNWDERFYDWALQTGKLEGKLYGLPGAYETLLVWYNKMMFEENGWKVPTNYTELTSLADQIQSKDIMPFAFGTSDFRTVNEWWLSIAYNSYLGPQELKKVLKGEQPWTSDFVKEATQTYVDMWKKGYINNKQSHAISMEDAWGVFNSKKAAMKMEGTWALSRLLNNPSPFDVGFFIMPSWRDGVEANLPIGLGDAIGINANSKHPDLAAELLDLIFSAQRAEKLVKLGQFSPMNGLEVSQVEGVDPLVVNVYETMNDTLEKGNAGYVSWTYFPPTVLSHLWNNIDSVLLDQTTVDEYLQKAQESMDNDVKNNMTFKFSD